MKFRHPQRGFTLIELLVVIVIIAILLAIAVPAYISQQKKAKSSKTKQYLVTAWRSARAEVVSNGGSAGYPLPNVISTLLRQDQPQIIFKVGTSSSATNNNEVVIDSGSTANTLILYSKSESGDIWKIQADPTAAGGDSSHLTNLGPPVTGYAQLVALDVPTSFWRLAANANDSVGSASPAVTNVTFGTATNASDGDKGATFASNSTITLTSLGIDYTANKPFTVESWVNPTTLDGTNRTIFRITSGSGDFVALESNSTQLTLRYFSAIGGGSTASIAPFYKLTTGSWFHLVITYDGTYLRLFRNNTLIYKATGAQIASAFQSNINTMYIGNNAAGTSGWIGVIDDVAIYSAALACAAPATNPTSACATGSPTDLHYLGR